MKQETFKNLESALQFGLGNGESFKPTKEEVNDIYNICINDLKDKFFEKAMYFKSDANPFTVDGECVVVNGYSYCEKSIDEYFNKILESTP